ncbi:MAG: glutamine amidotransferase [Dehalococcoidia bacterium]|nr:glutamine amidotransferase [Dehalococcoidia bacterium]
MKLRLAHLYPDHMNLYGDRGNVLCLQARCRWRGIDLEVVRLGLGDPFNAAAYDLVFIGGGPDREQVRVAQDLTEVKGRALKEAVEAGVALLAVCGGYQLLGHHYRPAAGPDLPGLGVFDAYTEHPGPAAKRCIGNLVAQRNGMMLVGFENHGGRTYLGPGSTPLATVERGFGNNGRDRTEGACYRNAFGTYLHGSFLPKNHRFTDHLLGIALERRGVRDLLTPLDDTLEERAQVAARKLALEPRKRFPWSDQM